MGQLGTTIAHCAKPALGLGASLCSDIDPSTAARFPPGEAGVIRTNHPVFIFGHLALYPRRALELCGLDASGIDVPERYDELFAAGKECIEATDGSHPSLDDVLGCWKASTEAAIARLPEADDAILAQENPIEGFRSRAPTIGDAANFLMNSHAMFHLGQLSAWRRAMGLASVM